MFSTLFFRTGFVSTFYLKRILGSIWEGKERSYSNAVCVPDYTYIINWTLVNQATLITQSWLRGGQSAERSGHSSYVLGFHTVMSLKGIKDPDL